MESGKPRADVGGDSEAAAFVRQTRQLADNLLAPRKTSALIEYVCTAHPHPSAVGPRFTIRDGAWAFCAGRGDDGHEWRRIEPSRPEFLGVVTLTKSATSA